MSRRLHLALLLALSMPAAHAALYSNPDGEGRLLLYPYYTVQGGRATLVSVSNDSAQGKLVKLSFHEGLGGQTVLDFNLALAPHDTWTAALFADPDGEGAALVTTDTSCSNPAIAANTALPQLPDGRRYVRFVNAQYLEDGGPTGLARTREGLFDAIELAELTAAQTEDASQRNCAALAALDADSGLTAPTGGLRGSAAVVNAAAGTYFSTPVTAVDGPARGPLGTALALVSDVSAVSSGTATSNDADVAIGAQRVHLAYAFDSARPSAPDALSALLMTDSLVGDFVVEPAAGANTEWVVSQPLKFAYVRGAAAPLAPYAERFDVTPDASCSPYAAQLWDREQHSVAAVYAGTGAAGLPAGAGALCHSVDVLQFGAAAAPTAVLASALGSSLSGFAPAATSGMALLQLGRSQAAAAAAILPAGSGGPALRGLPVQAFQVVNYVNANVTAGVLANYAASAAVSARKACADGDGAAIDCP